MKSLCFTGRFVAVQRLMHMRRMRVVRSGDGKINAFGCTECDWRHTLPNALSVSAHAGEVLPPEYAQARFEAHVCEQHRYSDNHTHPLTAN